jgi:hypothetical protein
LATFRSVSGQTFTDTIRLAQDMAAVFGTDITSAALQLGKALEDPERGLSALTRSGISFTPTQKEMIKNFVEMGNSAEAQRLILERVAQQVGGAGGAEADSLSGAFHHATAALGNFLEGLDAIVGTSSAVRDFLEGTTGALVNMTAALEGASPVDRIREINEEMAKLQQGAQGAVGFGTIGGPVGVGSSQTGAAQNQGRVAELAEEKRLLEENIRLENERTNQAAAQGAAQQAELRLEQAKEGLRTQEEELQKAAQRYETEEQGVARVNKQLDEQIEKLRQRRQALEENGGSPQDISRVADLAAQARKNAAAEIAALREPALEKARAEQKRQAAEAERIAKQQADAARRAADARKEYVRGLERELQNAVRLREAQALGVEAHQDTERAIQAENDVRGRKLDVTEEEAARLVTVRTEIYRIIDATKERQRVEEEAQRSQDAFFAAADRDIADETKEIKDAADRQAAEVSAAAEREAERSAQIISDIFAQPFQNMAGEVTNLTNNLITSLTRGGEEGGKSFAMEFNDAVQGIGTNLVSSIASAPINMAIGQLGSALQAQAATPGGGTFTGQLGAVGKWATASPLNAGLAGAAGGGLIGSGIGMAMGRPNSYASTGGSLGGAGGAAIGLMVGGPWGAAIGGALGGVGGGLLGGMFGGGDDNSGDNNMRQRYRPGQGVYYRESVQEGGEQNAQAVNQFMQQLQKVGTVFEKVGLLVNESFSSIDLKVGSNSGITMNGKKYGSIEEALGAAIGELGRRGYRAEGESIEERVARNTKATTAEELAADFEFGKEFERLTNGLGETGRAIEAVELRFDALRDKAEELGFSTRKLEELRSDEVHALKEEARLRIDVLTGNAGEYRQALTALNATYEEAKKSAIDLGQSTKDLNYARDQERARLKQEAEFRVGSLSGAFGEYQQALFNLNKTYEEAKKLAIDLGQSTKDLNYARDQERAKLRENAVNRIGALTGELGPYQQELIKLNQTYEEAKKLAIDLGMSTKDLNYARDQERRLLRENAERTVKIAGGDFGSFDEAMLQLNARFEEAKKLAIDLGQSTEKLNRVRDEERALLRTRFSTDLRVMMGEIDPLATEILNLRDAFRAANENARDLGISETDLVAARKRAEAELVEQRREQSREALLSQADNIRSLFKSVIDPLRQSTSAFGGLQGIAAPQASINSGLQEYRSTLARALNRDDLGAAQALPGVSQQLIQLARQYGASGPEFRKILEEVTRGNDQVEQRYRDREFEVMKSIPAEINRTGAETVRTLVDGFKRLLEANERLERAIKATKAGSPLAQAS